MQKLFVLMLVGLCSRVFCMAPGATPNGDNVENIRERMVVAQIRVLADYFTHHAEAETPVESVTQAFREMTAHVQNMRAFDQDNLTALGIRSCGGIVERHGLSGYMWVSLLRDFSVDNDDNVAQNDEVYGDEEEYPETNARTLVLRDAVVYGLLYFDDEEGFDELDGIGLSPADLRLAKIYTTHFAYVCELYNVLRIFMQTVESNVISDGQSRMVSRICKMIQSSSDVCRRMTPRLRLLLQENG